VVSRNDPDFSVYCTGKPASCNDAWALRILSSKNILIYGAGLYSFFDNYSTTCSTHTATTYTENCQTQIFGIDEGGSSQSYSGTTAYVYGLSTLGSVSMIDRSGVSIAAQSANTNGFAETVARYIS
jgi:glucan 1,3-beta-glucosidase